MFIQTDHIYLRALEPADLELLYICENDQAIWKISNTVAPFSKQVLQQYLEASQNDIYTNKQLRLMICKTQSHQCIGTIDLFEFEPLHARVGVGVLIFDAFRKQGYAYESIELVKHYVFDTLLLNQIYCNISASNTESIALFNKCGFKPIGLKKAWNRLSANSFEDEWMFQLVRST